MPEHPGAVAGSCPCLSRAGTGPCCRPCPPRVLLPQPQAGRGLQSHPRQSRGAVQRCQPAAEQELLLCLCWRHSQLRQPSGNWRPPPPQRSQLQPPFQTSSQTLLLSLLQGYIYPLLSLNRLG